MAVYTEIHIRRDSTLNWYASNPRLSLGEPGVDMDLHRFKIGNGIDRWNELPYMDDDLYKLLDKTQQDIADNVKALLNKINTNKIDSDQRINAISTEVRNTSRDLTGRMTAVENEQVEYEENLTGEFEQTKSKVNAGLEEFNDTRDALNFRMDVIVGSATEDTEILDARVDAKNVIHPNLGHNIRALHDELLGYENDETAERIAGDKNLQSQVDSLKEEQDNANNKQSQLREDIESEKATRQAEINQLQQAVDQEAEQREQADNTLQGDISAARQEVQARGDYLQEQANTLADLVISQAFIVKPSQFHRRIYYFLVAEILLEFLFKNINSSPNINKRE